MLLTPGSLLLELLAVRSRANTPDNRAAIAALNINGRLQT